MAQIYTYRIAHVYPAGGVNTNDLGYFTPQFSKDGGTTYAPVFTYNFYDLYKAQQSLAFILSAESQFQTLVNAGQFIPGVGYIAYP